MRIWITFFLGFSVGTTLAIEEVASEDGGYGPRDKAPETALYDYPIQVSGRVFSAIGATQPPTYENAGHNNNLSFVIGDTAVLVVNGGSNNALASDIHSYIKTLTSLPVKYVISENGQGHAFLGNHYWKSQGAILIGHVDAQKEIDEKGYGSLSRMREYAREFAQDTGIVNFDMTFDKDYLVNLGNVEVFARAYGSAHSPGDITVLIPSENVALAGDIAFHTRMPPIFDSTDSKSWIESFDVFANEARTMIIVPGHGAPTNIATVTAGTKDYLVYLRGEVQALLDNEGSLEDAYQIDQSRFKHWHTYKELAARNAGRVFERMEFE